MSRRLIAFVIGFSLFASAAVAAAAGQWAAAAPKATFNDVDPGSVHAPNIDWAATNNVTSGCAKPGGPNFCPDDQVRRDQMVSLLRNFAEGGIAVPAPHAHNSGDLQDQTRTLSVPAGAILGVNGEGNGAASIPGSATRTLPISRPADWAGGPVTVTFWFYTFSGSGNEIAIKLTAKDLNPGDGTSTGAESFSAAVTPSQNSVLHALDIAVDATALEKDLWVLSFVRSDNGVADMLLYSVDITYVATS